MVCHPERSEGSAFYRGLQMPRSAQDNKSQVILLLKRGNLPAKAFLGALCVSAVKSS